MCSFYFVRTVIQSCGLRRNLTVRYFSMGKFYAVRRGKIPGVYTTWDECKTQVHGFPSAEFKKFATENDAWSFVMDLQSAFPDISEVIPETEKNEVKVNLLGLPDPSSSAVCHPSSNTLATNKRIAETVLGTENYEIKTEASSVSSTTAMTLPNFSTSSIKNKIKTEADQLYQLGKRLYENSFQQSLAKKPRLASSATIHTASQVQLSNRKSKASRKASVTSVGNGQNSNIYKKFNVLTVNDPVDPNSVKVYTDGACIQNGKKGAKAGIGVYWGPNHSWNVSERLQGRQTNNRAEIHAAVKAITQAKSNGISKITVYTDSKFLICSITAWIKKWKKNGWKLSTGGLVKNAQDFIALDNALTGMDVKWVYIKGHAGFTGNEEADRLAREGINK